MVAGGIAISGHRYAEIEDAIAGIRERAGIRSEFHWSAYRGGNREAAYKELIDYAFELINKRQAALHIIVAKFEGYDHKAKAGENKDTSINRMYYQLLLHRIARLYGKTRAIHVRLDAGNDCADICEMRNQLCAAAFRKYQTKFNCVRTIEPVSSDKVGLGSNGRRSTWCNRGKAQRGRTHFPKRRASRLCVTSLGTAVVGRRHASFREVSDDLEPYV